VRHDIGSWKHACERFQKSRLSDERKRILVTRAAEANACATDGRSSVLGRCGIMCPHGRYLTPF
jgi:hypothetical protein